MEINPYVLRLMGEFATSEQQLQEWVEYHERAELLEVEEELAREEREEVMDLIGWED